MQQKMFLKIKGVRGESQNPRHFGEIEISGFAWSGKYVGAASGIGAGKALVNDLTVYKPSDMTSPVLWVACHTGHSFSEAVLTIEEVPARGSLLRSVALEMKPINIDSVTARESVSAEYAEEVKLNFDRLKLINP